MVIFIYKLISNDQTLLLKIYRLDTILRNIKLKDNLRLIYFTNYLSDTFSFYRYKQYESDSYLHFLLFSYMNSTDGNFKDLLKNNSLYEFKLSEYINSSTVENNISEYELINIKIINIPSNLNSENGISIAIIKNNKVLENNQILDLDERIKIKTINENNGVHFGKYYIEFVWIVKEPLTYEDSLTYIDEKLIFGINLINNEIAKCYESCYNENLHQFKKNALILVIMIYILIKVWKFVMKIVKKMKIKIKY